MTTTFAANAGTRLESSPTITIVIIGMLKNPVNRRIRSHSPVDASINSGDTQNETRAINTPKILLILINWASVALGFIVGL